jgi:hypothetical protein
MFGIALLFLGGCGGGNSSPSATSHIKNCSDFSTQESAQQYFDTNGGNPTNNFDGLDSNHNGIACEDLPHATPPPIINPPPPTIPPPDTTPPIISGIGVSSIYSAGAIISWSTNEAASSQVEYGITTAYGSVTPLNSSMTTGHFILLSGLAASTTYHYRVKSSDVGGNPAISSDNTFSTTTAPPPPAKIELKGTINMKQDSLGFVHYLGELINIGDLPACFVKITINSMDGGGALISTDYTYVDGSPMLVSIVIMTDTCLRPGEFGGFEVFTLLTSIPTSFAQQDPNWDPSNISEPPVTPAQLIIDGTITEGTDGLGNKTLLGMIKNLHPSITVEFVKISVVALNGTTVVATDFTYINGSTCGSPITTDTCLVPGASGSFSISFNEPPSNIMSYYYKISYDAL